MIFRIHTSGQSARMLDLPRDLTREGDFSAKPESSRFVEDFTGVVDVEAISSESEVSPIDRSSGESEESTAVLSESSFLINLVISF